MPGWPKCVCTIGTTTLAGPARCVSPIGQNYVSDNIGGEVAAEQVLERLPDPAHVGAVRAVAPPAPYAAPEPDLAHHLEDRLVGHPDAELGPEAHRHLPVPAAVGGPREHLLDRLPQLRPGGPGRVLAGVVVRRPRHPRREQQVALRDPVEPRQRVDHLGLLPVARLPAIRACNFFR